MKSTHRRKSGVLFLSQKPYKCEGHLTVFWNKKKSALSCRLFALSDLARIQTWNLLSRNQVRYSVAPQGHLFISNLPEASSGCAILPNYRERHKAIILWIF